MASERPQSVTDLRVNLVGLLSMVVVSCALAASAMDLMWAAVLTMLAMVVPVAGLDLWIHKVHRRASTGLEWNRPDAPIAWSRIAVKWLGASAVLAMVGAVYWLAPEYQGSFYDQFYAFLWHFGPPAAIFGAIYIAWIDGRLADPHDAYWHAGNAVLGRWQLVDREKLIDLLRTWVIKGFFVPLMFTYLTGNLNDLRMAIAHPPETWIKWYDALYSFGFLVDLVFTTAGYLVTVRVLDTHVRSAQPSMSGWVVAVMCYQPFFSLVSRQYLFYNNEFYWGEWLADVPAVKFAWGVALLLTTAIFSSATVAFGCRFSNLTNRGIITGGIYRFTKHPAYISKCTSYWLLFIPFVWHGSTYEIVRDCFWLSALCGVYWARARTEEIHLSEDPAYSQYARYIEEHGVFRIFGRILPFLRYRAPRTG